MTRKTIIPAKYIYLFCLTALFVTAFLLRAYRLGELPDVLHVDEAGIGYNAWCLANYGVDRYLNEWPIYPQNYYYGGQSPLYTYLLVLLIKLFPALGATSGLIRIPAVLSGMLTVICTAKMLKILFDNKMITLAGTALVTFCPYFIMASRYALDCNMMLGTSVLAITLLLRYLHKPTWYALLWCGGGFALVLYTYAVSYLALPVFLVLISLYMLYTKKIEIGRLAVLAGEICLLALPLILFVICLLFKLPGFRFLGLNILPIATQRLNDLSPSGFVFHFFHCIKVALTHNYYYMDAVDKYYTMYAVSIPFIAVGFVWSLMDFLKSLRNRCFSPSAIYLIYAGAVLSAVSLSGGSGLVHRANALFVCFVYFCIAGIRAVLCLVRRFRRLVGAAVGAVYIFCTVSFLGFYFTAYSVADSYTYPNSYYFVPEKEALVDALKTQDVSALYIDCFFEEFIYFYYPVSPYENENADPLGGMSRIFYASVDQDTPIEESAVYMVRKENSGFIENLQKSGLSYETKEFAYYYVFTLP